MIQRQALVVPFTKMNGAGNDFIVLDNRFLHFSTDELAELARRFCPRRTGVGADGLLALDDAEDADFRMRYRNADGSLGTMCGNGARCLARFAARAGLGREADGATHLTFETDGGRYSARVTAEAVELDVPAPRAFEVEAPASALGTVHPIWTGTEHAVVFVDRVEDAPVAEEGARLRQHEAFAPTGTNVNFVERQADGATVRVRTFEKGVEVETLACGTGALASALVAHRAGGLAATAITVEMPGGALGVSFRDEGGEIRDLRLSGPAETVYEGTLEWWG
ncbi:MAG TPA: diaminopimelate epimerase [Bacteroidetes bacterium]|nr:diaminopimelate epimerase [Bacteroidota bacterium]HIL58409.1 diaminopimelate epimerase [Rhodothermales bacterium]